MSPAPLLSDRRATWLLAALIAIGAALRLYGLGTQSLWNDELSTWYRSVVTAGAGLFVGAAPADHPPGYFVLMRLWTRFFGDSESLLRLPSALCGIAAIAAIHALGLRLYGRREALIAAALTTVAWMPIFYSQEARSYSLLFLLVMLTATWLIDIVRALRSAAPTPRGAAIGYVITASLTCYVHYFGLMAIGLQAALAVVALRREGRALGKLAMLYAVIVLLYVPQLSTASVVLRRGLDWLAPPGVAAPWELLCFLFNQSDAFAAIAVVLWIVLLVREQAGRDGDPGGATSATFVLFAWMVLPVSAVWVRSILIAPAFLDRALIIVAPAAYLLTARGITRLSHRVWVAPLATGALVGALLTNLIVTQHYYTTIRKEPFREAAAYVVARDRGESSTLVLAFAHSRTHFDYYFIQQGSARRVDAAMSSASEIAAAQELIAERAPANVWVLAGHVEPDQHLIDMLGQRYRLQDEAHWRHVHVWRFTSDTPPRP